MEESFLHFTGKPILLLIETKCSSGPNSNTVTDLKDSYCLPPVIPLVVHT